MIEVGDVPYERIHTAIDFTVKKVLQPTRGVEIDKKLTIYSQATDLMHEYIMR
jgi:hypothetical protein